MNFLENLYGNFYLSQSVDGAMSDGTYELVLQEKTNGIGSAIRGLLSFLTPSFKVGKVYGDENGRKITIVDIDAFEEGSSLGSITFELVNGSAAPQKAGIWTVGIFTLLGLGLAAFTVVEIRKLIPKETINLILITICGVVIFALYKLWWSKK